MYQKNTAIQMTYKYISMTYIKGQKKALQMEGFDMSCRKIILILPQEKDLFRCHCQNQLWLYRFRVL
jgi:hypothetical protein